MLSWVININNATVAFLLRLQSVRKAGEQVLVFDGVGQALANILWEREGN
jgi:hypothetical protein